MSEEGRQELAVEAARFYVERFLRFAYWRPRVGTEGLQGCARAFSLYPAWCLGRPDDFLGTYWEVLSNLRRELSRCRRRWVVRRARAGLRREMGRAEEDNQEHG
jgi:hypothetical protein